MRNRPPATRSTGGRSTAGSMVAGVLGAGLLLASGGIHLDLYLTGYRHIPTIGWMFLVQVIAALLLGLGALAVTARPRRSGSDRTGRALVVSLQQLVTGSAALFALATLGGYLLSLAIGLFGFKEIRTTAGVVAAILEIAAFVLLGWVATAGVGRRVAKAVLLGPPTVVAAILLVVAETSSAAAGGPVLAGSTPAPGGAEITVVIKNFTFQPHDPTARPGEKIVVKNDDSVAHTFSTEPGAATADAFTTGAVPPGGTRVVTAPSHAGSYPFLCLIHQFMTGTLTVSGSG
ncbi:MAG: cupredoxin domain-containing protein [Acidimicrobiales bacterium]